MRLLKGLALSFAAIAAVVYGLAFYSDPEGFWDALKEGHVPPRGEALSLEAFVLKAAAPAEQSTPVLPPSLVLLPPSEAEFDPTFLTYRQQFQAAVEARDLEAVLSLVSVDVLLSVEGEQGRLQMGELLEAPDAGEAYWQKLEGVLTLPSAALSEADYCAPYVSCAPLPEGAEELEPFETAFAIKPNVPVRIAPFEGADVVSSLSYQSVQLAAALEDPLWAEVILSDGGTGFVARSDIRLMLGARAEFSKEDGIWQMRSFLPGS